MCCSDFIDPSLLCVVLHVSNGCRWLVDGSFVFLLEVGNLFESRHIPMQDDDVELKTNAFLAYDVCQKRLATFMAKIRVQCLFTSIIFSMTK